MDQTISSGVDIATLCCIAGGIAGLVLLVITLLGTFVIVGGSEIATLERRLFGRDLPQGRVIAQANEVGKQARVLGPGFHALIPWLYKATKVRFTVIDKNKVGLVESIDGDPVQPGQIFGRAVNCNFFQDGAIFLKNGGQKGPQVQLLPPGIYKINPSLFKVEVVEAISIEEGEIGVIVARDGKSIPVGRLLGTHIDNHNNFQDGEAFLKNGGQKGPQLDILLPGTYYLNTRLFEIKHANATVLEAGRVGMVEALDGMPLPENEFVAKDIDNHHDFQDGAAFLINGGQRGPQLDVLKPGIYYINPLMFGVVSTPVTEVQRGQVAVIVSNIGQEPDDKVKQRFMVQATEGPSGKPLPVDVSKETYVVPKGYRGIQEEVAGPGRYYFNTRAFIPYIVDTTNLTIDWDVDEQVDFDPLQVVSQDGFKISVSVKVITRVRPDQAPYMVAKVGSVDNLVKNVIHPMIDSSFRNQASITKAMDFMQNRKEEQLKAENYVRDELEKYHVECVSVLICQIILPQDLMDTQTKKIIAQQEVGQYIEQQKAEESRITVEKTRATASAQLAVVNAEVAVSVAEQKKQETITLAEGDAQSVRLRGEGEAAAIKAKGTAQAEALTAQQKAVGPSNLTMIKVAEQVSQGNIKIMPDILTMGGSSEGGLSGILTKLIASNMTTKKAG